MSDWSSDVCSSDLDHVPAPPLAIDPGAARYGAFDGRCGAEARRSWLGTAPRFFARNASRAAVCRGRGMLRGDGHAAGAYRGLLWRPGLRLGKRSQDAFAHAEYGHHKPPSFVLAVGSQWWFAHTAAGDRLAEIGR